MNIYVILGVRNIFLNTVPKPEKKKMMDMRTLKYKIK